MKPSRIFEPIKQIKLFFMLTLFFILAAFFMSSKSWAATYYVDATNGNNSNNELSMSSSWKTIVEVNASRFQPEDLILVKRGESGSKVKPISFN